MLQVRSVERLIMATVPPYRRILLSYVNGIPSEALEKVKSIEPDAIGGGTRIEAHRSRGRFRKLAIEAPGPPGDEAWNGVVLLHGADQILVTPVPEEVVRLHHDLPSYAGSFCAISDGHPPGGLRRENGLFPAPDE